MSKFITSDPPYNAGLYPTKAGFLQLVDGAPLDNTFRKVTDLLNTLSPLELSTHRIRMNTTAAASRATLQITSTPFTIGNANTNHPVLLFGDHGGEIWAFGADAGTYLGINAEAGFKGNLLDFHIGGNATSVFKVAASGAVTTIGPITAPRNIGIVNIPPVSAGAVTVNCASGEFHNINLVNGVPTAITLTNPAIGVYMLNLKQGTSGSCLATWSTTIIWSGGSAPVLTTAANRIDIITLIYDGVTWRGVPTFNFAS
jgi:hypothetical protein